MNYGRPTTDPKGDSIRIRLNDEMKRWVFYTAKEQGITVSEFIRNLIKNEMNSM